MSANPNRSASSGQPSTPIAANQKGSKKTTPQSQQSNIPVGPITESVINTSSTDIGNATVQKNTTGPPASIQPKPQLTRAERRAIQEAQRATKDQAKTTTALAKQQEGHQGSAGSKKIVSDHTPTVSNPTSTGSNRTQSESAETVASTTSKTSRLAQTTSATNMSPATGTIQTTKNVVDKKKTVNRVTLFSHLVIYTRQVNRLQDALGSKALHPAIVKLGFQFATREIVGSNLRCIAFLGAIQKLIADYHGPSSSDDSGILMSEDLNATLKSNINFLTKCRPNAVTIGAAIRFIKTHIQRIPRDITEKQAKEFLDEEIRNFMRQKIELPGKAIAETYVISKITNGDVILIFGYSSLTIRILETAMKRGINFRVIIVDSRPQKLGLRSAKKLLAMNVRCTYILINAVPFIISEVTKVLLGAHGLLGNGYVMSQIGTAQIALIAKTHNVPVLVCCETYKFSERVQTDSFVFNELGDPDDLTTDFPELQGNDSPSSNPNFNILNMTYDVTPPTFISAVITELGILPCTSVAVVIRMQNKQLDEIYFQDQLSNTATVSLTNAMNSETIQ